MKNSKTLIHCALLAEAKPLVGFFKLQKISQNLYENETMLLCVSGMGKKNTLAILETLLSSYTISKAVNIGIAGCSDKNIPIGELFCTSQPLLDIAYASLESYDEPVTKSTDINTILVDMEAQSFLEVTQKHLNKEDIFVFKVVSDYLDDTIPSKAFVATLIQKNLTKIRKYV